MYNILDSCFLFRLNVGGIVSVVPGECDGTYLEIMKFIPFSEKAMLGIDMGSYAIKVVEARFLLGKPVVLRAVCEEINSDRISDPDEKREAYVAALKKIIRQNKIKTKNTVIAIPSNHAGVRIIKLPKTGGGEDAGATQAPADTSDMPFEIQAAETYTQPLEGTDKDGKPDRKILLVAGNRNTVIDNFKIAREAGLDPVIADIDVFAVLNIYMLGDKPTKKEFILILDIGAGTTNIAIVENGIIKVVRTVFLAGNNFTRTLQQEFNISQEEAEALKKKHGLSTKRTKDNKDEKEEASVDRIHELLSGQVDQISTEVTRTISYFTEKMMVSDIHISKVELTGGSADMPGLADYLNGKLEIPVEIFRPLEKLDFHHLKNKSCVSLPCFAAAAGLSLRRPQDRGRMLTRINLLPKTLIKNSHSTAAIVACFLSLALLFAGYYWYNELSEKIQAGLIQSKEELAAVRIRLTQTKDALSKKKAAQAPKITAVRAKPPAPKAKHPYIAKLAISGVFADSSGSSAMLAGPDKLFVVKNEKMYDENGEVVHGISALITQKSVILSAGDEKYELPIPK